LWFWRKADIDASGWLSVLLKLSYGQQQVTRYKSAVTFAPTLFAGTLGDG